MNGYFGPGNLYAINTDGTLKWKFPKGEETTDQIKSSPAIARDGTIYFGTHSPNFFALNPDGTLKWDFQAESWVNAPIAIDKDGTIYFGTINGMLQSLRSDGTLRWQYQVPTGKGIGTGIIHGSPAIDNDGTIYFNSDSGNCLFALYNDGNLKWELQASQREYRINWSSSPVIASDGTIYIGSDNKGLIAVDSSNGKIKWTSLTVGSIASSPVIDEGIIYFGSGDGHLYAIDSGTNAGLKNTPWPMLGQNPRHTSNASDYKNPTSVEDTLNEQPTEFYLQNYPNPFNQTTIIKYKLPENTKVSLDVYNSNGQKVKTLVNNVQESGMHQVNFNASDLSSGTYFSKLKTLYGVNTQKMMLVK